MNYNNNQTEPETKAIHFAYDEAGKKKGNQ